MNECRLSRFCKNHSNVTKSCVNLNLMTGFLTATAINNDSKEILCRLINDKAVNKICEGDGLTIEQLEEINYEQQNKAVGYNFDYNKKIQLVVKYNDKLLQYNELISILLHEITHSKYRDHGKEFISYEKSLREKYVKYSRECGLTKVWDSDFEFSTSLGTHIVIKSIDENENLKMTMLFKIVFLLYFTYKFLMKIFFYPT